MVKTQLFIGMALIVGVAIGYFVKPSDATASASDGGYVAKASVADKGGEASMSALRRRIAELERQLAEKGGEAAETPVSNVEASAQRPGWGNPREWLENMRKNDPDRYAQMTNRWARWRSANAERTQAKVEFLSGVDVSRMGAKAQEVHQSLLDAIVRREELVEQIHQEDMTDDQRHRLMEELRASDRELRRLNGQERGNLIREAARNSGVKGKMAQELTETIKDVIDATDGGWGGPHHGPPPGGPRGR